MASIIAPKDQPSSNLPVGRDSSGIALFMVLSAISVLAILVTEFTYIAQIGQMIAFGGLDQTKAHYIAKSGLKISLLRLKAYQQVKVAIKTLTGGGGGAAPGVPKSLINKIWSFPFFYPIPTNIPGMSQSDKQMIDKFQKDSGLEGRFSALIESESSKYNLNLLLPAFAASPSPGPSGSPTSSASGSPQDPDQPQTSASSQPNPVASYNPETARTSLYNYLNNIMSSKLETDPDFASLYRDFRLDDFLDTIVAWADKGYERKTSLSIDKVPMKRAPFYSISELHMLPTIDDDLYNLFAPALTASSTGGININTMQESTLRALVPAMTPDEVKEFFKFRDSEEADNQFGGQDDFFKYLQEKVAYFKNNQKLLDDLKQDIAKRGIMLVTEENQFKITVQAQVNSATRTIEAWVTLGESSAPAQPTQNPNGAPPPLSGPGPNGPGGTTVPVSDSGLKITFMKIL